MLTQQWKKERKECSAGKLFCKSAINGDEVMDESAGGSFVDNGIRSGGRELKRNVISLFVVEVAEILIFLAL